MKLKSPYFQCPRDLNFVKNKFPEVMNFKYLNPNVPALKLYDLEQMTQ